MIERIFSRHLWAESFSEKPAGRSVTIYVGEPPVPPRITAQINLSRVAGGGEAKAFISGYEYFASDSEPLFQPLEPPGGNLLTAPSVLTINSARSVTFSLRVNQMFAYATCVVFVHSRNLLAEIGLSAELFVKRLMGP